MFRIIVRLPVARTSASRNSTPNGAALRAVLASGQYYPLDAVLRLKR